MFRVVKGALIAVITFSLSGCFAMEVEYEVHEDLSLSFNAFTEIDIAQMEEAGLGADLDGQGGTGAESESNVEFSPTEEEAELIRSILGDRFTYEPYEDDSTVRMTVSMERVTAAEFEELGNLAESGSFTNPGGFMDLGPTVDTSNDGYTIEEKDGEVTFVIRNAAGNDTPASETRLYEQFIQFSGGITMPGEILEQSTGTIDPENPNRIDLAFADMDASEITVISRAAGNTGIDLTTWLIAGGALLLILALIVTLLIVKRRRTSETYDTVQFATPAPAYSVAPPAQTFYPQTNPPHTSPPQGGTSTQP